MATEAYGVDFWIGKILRSKDSRELWRHVVISDMRNGRAKCHNLIVSEDGHGLSMWKRGSMISLKSLAKRWEPCRNPECFCKRKSDGEASVQAETAKTS